MDVWMWVLIAVGAVVAAWLKRRARRARIIDHIRVEVHPGRVIDDRVVEKVWRSAISMTNQSRRPRVVPTLAERATLRAGWPQ